MLRRAPFVFALLVALVACGTPAGVEEDVLLPPRAPPREVAADASVLEPNTPNEIAGTRLRPRYVEERGADGSRLVRMAGWWDGTRHEACSPATAADARLRCLPSGEVPVFPWETTFVDAACTRPLVVVNRPHRCSPAPEAGRRYVQLAPAGPLGCDGVVLAALDEPRTPRSSRTFFQRRGARCELTSLPEESFEAFELSGSLVAIPSAAFTAMETMVADEDIRSRLWRQARVTVGEDGAMGRGWPTAFDAVYAASCAGGVAEDGARRCLPRAAPLVPAGFADAGCRERAVAEAPSGCEPRRPWLELTGDRCGSTAVFPRRDTPQTRVVHVASAGRCDPVASDAPAFGLKDLGPAIPPAAFVALSVGIEPAESGFYGLAGVRLSIRQRVERGEGYVGRGPPSFWDALTGARCYASIAVDGVLRCVGGYEWLVADTRSGTFADAACSEPIVATVAGCEGRATEAVPFVAESVALPDGCDAIRVYRVSGVGARRAAVFVKAAGGCSAVSADGLAVHAIADLEPVRPDAFVALTSTLR